VDQNHNGTLLDGRVASLILVRLSKLCLHWYNHQLLLLYAPLNDCANDCQKVAAVSSWWSHASSAAAPTNQGTNQESFRPEDARQIFDRILETIMVDALVPRDLDQSVTKTRSEYIVLLDDMVEATKAVAILARIETDWNRRIFAARTGTTTTDGSIVHVNGMRQLMQAWEQLLCVVLDGTPLLRSIWDETHVVGLQWALDTIQMAYPNDSMVQPGRLPLLLEAAYRDFSVPFRVVPGALTDALSSLGDNDNPGRLVSTLRHEVDFAVDEICAPTTSIAAAAAVVKVPERRWTAWQGDNEDSVGPFEYSGKSMPRQDWSPTVQAIRNVLAVARGAPPLHGSSRASMPTQNYNACLLNLYPDGASGMRYHCDPDQGTKWDYDTAVVSLGAARRFAIRPIPHHRTVALSLQRSNRPHSLVVFHSDVTYMWGDCQERFQHAVKNADFQQVSSPRISLVFKRTWNCSLQEH
jgi:alkylated DNA repair dioxygenase AlkB/uncharacterized protein (UPF0147 family)